MKATAPPQPALTQLVLKPTVYCFHRCPYCDPRQDYYRDIVAARKTSLKLVSPGESSKRVNPGHMPLDLALRTIDEAAALGMRSMQLSGGDPCHARARPRDHRGWPGGVELLHRHP